MRVLCRILCRAFRRVFDRVNKMGIRDLAIMILGNSFAVAQPVADDVGGKPLGQFRLSGAPQVVEQFRPRRTPARRMMRFNCVRRLLFGLR